MIVITSFPGRSLTPDVTGAGWHFSLSDRGLLKRDPCKSKYSILSICLGFSKSYESVIILCSFGFILSYVLKHQCGISASFLLVPE